MFQHCPKNADPLIKRKLAFAQEMISTPEFPLFLRHVSYEALRDRATFLERKKRLSLLSADQN